MHTSARLHIPADEAFLPLVTAFMDQAGEIFGLPEQETLSLHLAAEEIFLHVAHFVSPAEEVEISCGSISRGVRSVFAFPADTLDLGALNLTASFSVDQEMSMQRLGLFLAARAVDHLKVERPRRDLVRLIMEKEKPYSLNESFSSPPPATRSATDIRLAKADDMGQAAALISRFHPHGPSPEACKYPQRLVDMHRGGEMSAFVGLDSTGLLGGALLWHWLSPQTVECYGPYLFGDGQGQDVAQALVEALIGHLGRSSCISLVNHCPAGSLPPGYFQKLGCLELGPKRSLRSVSIRMLKEDPGSLVWARSLLVDFLTSTYDRLALPREIHNPEWTAELEPESVFFSQLSQMENAAWLYPEIIGRDMEASLEKHVHLFAERNVANVFVRLDLGQSAHCELIEPLSRLGFEPRLVIPYGGQGDLLIYQAGAGCF
ncbi:MAG: hypothetical protein ACLFQG_07980 [Desulfovermiculus sp.]